MSTIGAIIVVPTTEQHGYHNAYAAGQRYDHGYQRRGDGDGRGVPILVARLLLLLLFAMPFG